MTSTTAGEISLGLPTARYVVVESANRSLVIRVLGISQAFTPMFRSFNAAGAIVLDAARPGSTCDRVDWHHTAEVIQYWPRRRLSAGQA